ncbi:uncharacterized protein [Littorina saxatilis]|uniref:uncharacterized protein isoform X3 n=1 Tax=Littorina saxatilis TaxID=31220 RepID=UPI0038B53E3C
MATSLLIGGHDERESAKRRRKAEYAQDLELQMREKDAARKRERMQDMSVNASGYLDPEKGPERFKPLGGVHWTEERGRRVDRVKPYHTLFLYGNDGQTPRSPRTNASVVYDRTLADPVVLTGRSPRLLDPGVVMVPEVTPRPSPRKVGTPPGLKYQPATYATTGVAPNQPLDQAYNVTGVGYPPPPAYHGSIVQPISMPDHRPVILTNTSTVPVYDPGPRYVSVGPRPDDGAQLRNIINISQAERDRLRRENDEFQRRLRRELDDERRKLQDQEAEARRRMEESRREAEARRREADRERAEAERLRRLKDYNPPPTERPVTNIVRPQSKTHVYYDMNDYRQRLIEERRKIEALLKSGQPVKEVWDVKVLPRQRINLPPTPPTDDNANRDRVREFNNLKYRDYDARDQFRTVYPDVPVTNRRLEEQQEALLREQEEKLRDISITKTTRRGRKSSVDVSPRRAVSRPSWMDRCVTPFPHVLRKRDRMYTTVSCDCDRDLLTHRHEDRYSENLSYRSDDIGLDSLRLRKHRSNSADTLTDETWLRPSSTAEV